MFNKRLMAGVFIFIIAVADFVGASVITGNRTLLAVPARYKIVQLSFDIVSLRHVNLVSYQKEDNGSDMLLHLWTTNGVWKEISPALLQSGALNIVATAVVGPDADDFINYTDAHSWGGAIKRIPTFDIPTILNALNVCYNFKVKEWKWLAYRYKINVEDTNWEERRYGKYGPPGQERKPPVNNTTSTTGPASYHNSATEPTVTPVIKEDVVEESEILDVNDDSEVINAVNIKEKIKNKSGNRAESRTTKVRLDELLPENK